MAGARREGDGWKSKALWVESENPYIWEDFDLGEWMAVMLWRFYLRQQAELESTSAKSEDDKE